MGKWLTIRDLEDRLQMDRRTVRRLADAGELPPGVKLGRGWRWSEDEIREHMDAKIKKSSEA